MLLSYTGCVARRGFGDLRDRMCCRHGGPIPRVGFCRVAQYESVAEETHSSGMSECDKSGHKGSHVRTTLFTNIRHVERKKKRHWKSVVYFYVFPHTHKLLFLLFYYYQ